MKDCILDKKYVCAIEITGGIPACRESSAAAKAVRGVSSDGFITTVQPQARAGPTYPSWKENKSFENEGR